jgi:hypothetical protein
MVDETFVENNQASHSNAVGQFTQNSAVNGWRITESLSLSRGLRVAASDLYFKPKFIMS